MANIALLNRCNLRCPYCFADNYTEGEREDINMDNFLSLLDFSADDREVGIIGGEPLLHKNICGQHSVKPAPSLLLCCI